MKKEIRRFFNFLKKSRFVYKSNYQLIKEKLKAINGLVFINTEANFLPIRVLIDSIELNVNTLEEAFILKELYNDNDYYFSLNEETVLIDVGMNVGFTSLFYAKNNNIRKVYSFEPVRETFFMAQTNINLNPKLSDKIITYNFGLGNQDIVEEFVFSSEYKGSVGVRGLKSWNVRNAEDKTIIKVEIKAASKNLKPIIDNNNKFFVVCKLDCEGSEYNILQDMFDSGLIEEIGMFIIEYHDNGPEFLEELFFKKGFITLIKRTAPHLGIIYAINKILK